jgi:hypothetical protein
VMLHRRYLYTLVSDYTVHILMHIMCKDHFYRLTSANCLTE